MRTSIIIPVHNEARSIREVLARVQKNVPPSVEVEIIAVDDGSTDGSLRILEGTPGISLVPFPGRRGKGSALKAAFARASGDYILIQDADLEYFPEDYPAIFGPVLAGKARAVFGSRRLRRNARNRLYALGDSLVTRIFNARFGTHLTDIATCYKLFPREVAEDLAGARENDFAFDVFRLTLAIVRRGEPIVEVPVRYAPRTRREGKKLNPRDGLRILFLALREPKKPHA